MRPLSVFYPLMAVGCRTGVRDQPSSPSQAEASGAERVVQQAVDAWNKHDRFPDQLLTSSRDSLGARWTEMFSKEPKVRVTISPVWCRVSL
jgi:hypothetical protein